MAKKPTAPKTEQQASKPNDYSIEIELSDQVKFLVENNDEVRVWRKDVYEQLVMWRNIPHPQQISYGDSSVRKIAYARGIENPLQPKGKKEKDLMERIRQGVIAKSIQAREDLQSTVVTLSLLKNTVVFDERNGEARLRPDVAALIGEERLEEGIEQYFANQPEGKFSTVFPTLDRDVPAEMAVALENILVEEFPSIGEKIREALAEIDRLIDAAEQEETTAVVDGAGFQSE